MSINKSATLPDAARSDPRDNRLIFASHKNGECLVEVQDCFDIGALTFEINGDSTEIICTDLDTGENVVVGVIESGSTKKATFDLSRYLPANYLSAFLEQVRQNCNIRMYIARGDECIDPFNVNEFKVLDIFGEVTHGNYTRTELRHKDKSQAASIMEGSTITAYDFQQVALQFLAVRGETTTDPIVGLTLCDKRSCGGKCADDSDGCQKWLWVTATGDIGYTNNQFFTENQATGPTLGVSEVITDICCVKDQVVVLTEENTSGQGAIHYTNLTNLLNGGTPTWTSVTTDNNTVLLENLNDCEISPNRAVLWMVGDTGKVYQYNPTLGVVVEIPGVAGLTSDFNFIDILGDTILIGGVSATVIRSQDGGRSFQQVTITDPATGAPLGAGIALTAGDVLTKVNWAVGTDDDRVIYTLDDGDTFKAQVIPGAGAGVITDMHFDLNLVGFLTRNEGGSGVLLKTYYGNCEPWLTVPENNDPLPTNGGLAKVVNCPDNPNVAVAVGETTGGAGLIFVATSEYK